MPYVTEANLTDVALERWKDIPDPRLRQKHRVLTKCRRATHERTVVRVARRPHQKQASWFSSRANVLDENPA